MQISDLQRHSMPGRIDVSYSCYNRSPHPHRRYPLPSVHALWWYQDDFPQPQNRSGGSGDVSLLFGSCTRGAHRMHTGCTRAAHPSQAWPSLVHPVCTPCTQPSDGPGKAHNDGDARGMRLAHLPARSICRQWLTLLSKANPGFKNFRPSGLPNC